MRFPRIRGTLSWTIALAALAGCEGGSNSTAPATTTPPPEPPTYLGPEITLEEPGRGAMLMAGGVDPSPVTLRGQGCDSVHAITGLQIDGQAVPLTGTGSCQAFELAQSSRLGLSIVQGQIANDAGERGTLAQSFIRSPEYFSDQSGDPASSAESGLLLQLNPPFLDDGDRSTPDDIASIAQLALASLDVDAAVGPFRFASPDANGDAHLDTVTHGCVFFSQTNKRTGYEAWKSGPVTTTGITVDQLALQDGGISARITVHNPRVPFSVTGNLDLGCAGAVQDTVSGEATAAALILDGRAAVGLAALGVPQIAFTSLAATLSGLQLDIDLGPLDFTGLGSVIGNAIAGAVQGPIQAAIGNAVRGTLDDRLSGVLAGLTAFQSTLTLPPALASTELILESGVDRLDFSAARAVIGTFVRVRPALAVPEHAAASAFGAMKLGGTIPDIAGFGAASLVLGLKDDTLNQFLHAAWLGGAFDASDLTSRGVNLGIPGAQLAILSTLPPLVMPRLGAPGLDLGWGDVSFDLKLPAVGADAEVQGFFSVILPIEDFAADPGGQTFGPIFGDAEVHVQVARVNWGKLPATRQELTELLQAALTNLLPQVLGSAVNAFPLPTIDLRGIDGSLPGVVLGIQDPQLARLGSYELIAGTVAALP